MSMAILHPQRQTIIIVLVCILAVAGTAYYVYGQKGFESSVDFEPIVTSSGSNSKQNSGIGTSTDWQKQFFDSTGKKTVVSGSASSKSSTKNEKLTTTDQLGRSFFNNYVQLEQTNRVGDQNSVKNAVDYSIDTALGNIPELKTYTSANIIISQNNTPAAARTYGNTVSDVLEKYAPRADAALIASEAFEGDDLSQLGGIDVIIQGYVTTIPKLLAVPVPSAIAANHVALVNGISAILYVSQGLRVAETDPVQAMVALGTYKVARNSLRNALLSLKEYFIDAGIVFSANEPGSAFESIE